MPPYIGLIGIEILIQALWRIQFSFSSLLLLDAFLIFVFSLLNVFWYFDLDLQCIASVFCPP